MIKAGDQRWHEVFERDRGHCRYCGCDLLATFEHYYFAEVDHLLPPTAADRDELKNIVLACRACNGRLSRAHRLGHITFEARKAYLTFPRFHRHLYKEECDEIGGRNDHENQTAVHGRV